MMKIPNIVELEPNENGIYEFNLYYILPFYIKENTLCYELRNKGQYEKFRCARNIDEYKILSYRVMGSNPHSRYFILNTKTNKVQAVNTEWADINEIIEWVNYLKSGGTLQKAIEENKKNNSFDVTKGI